MITSSSIFQIQEVPDNLRTLSVKSDAQNILPLQKCYHMR